MIEYDQDAADDSPLDAGLRRLLNMTTGTEPDPPGFTPQHGLLVDTAIEMVMRKRAGTSDDEMYEATDDLLAGQDLETQVDTALLLAAALAEIVRLAMRRMDYYAPADADLVVDEDDIPSEESFSVRWLRAVGVFTAVEVALSEGGELQ